MCSALSCCFAMCFKCFGVLFSLWDWFLPLFCMCVWHVSIKLLTYLLTKRLKVRIALYGNPSQSYGTSLAIWDHTVLPATRHKWTRPALTPARQTGARFTYPGGMGGCVDLGSLIAARSRKPRICWLTGTWTGLSKLACYVLHQTVGIVIFLLFKKFFFNIYPGSKDPGG